jgi:chromosome segregation protein
MPKAALSAIETALEAAREAEAGARQPVTEAKARLNAIETEAKTISRMLNAGQGSDLFPPVVEKIKVDRGYETALGAALGDDLDLPLDPAAPAHWARIEGIG